MKFASLLALFIVSTSLIIANGKQTDRGSSKSNTYNILSIEGGGIRGIIPAVIIDYVEEYAFQYAVKKKYNGFKDRNEDPKDRHRIQCKDLFDMIAGTSSSSILTAYLTRPTDKSTNDSYYAQDAIQYYMDEGSKFFQSRDINYGLVGILVVLSSFMGLFFGYKIGVLIFANPKKLKKLNELKKLINALKEIKIDGEFQAQNGIQHDEPTFLNTMNDFRRSSTKKQLFRVTQFFKHQGEDKVALEIEEELDNGENAVDIIQRKKTQIVQNMQQRMTQIGIKPKENFEMTKLLVKDTDENMHEVVSRLEKLQLTQQEKKNKKWIIAVFGFIILGAATFFLSIVIFNIAKPSLDRTYLQDSLALKFARYKISDRFPEQAMLDETMLISYAYNQQQPRFYSKFEAERNPYIFDVQVDEAVVASTSLLMYYDPYKMQLGLESQEVLVDGAIIAQNPSFYSLIHAKELKKKNFVKVVSIGSGYSNFDDIDFASGNFILSVLSDANHIIDLFSYIKARSHSYWTSFVTNNDPDLFQEFVFSPPDKIDFNNLKGKDMDDIRRYGEEYLLQNKKKLQEMIEPIVDQRYRG